MIEVLTYYCIPLSVDDLYYKLTNKHIVKLLDKEYIKNNNLLQNYQYLKEHKDDKGHIIEYTDYDKDDEYKDSLIDRIDNIWEELGFKYVIDETKDDDTFYLLGKKITINCTIQELTEKINPIKENIKLWCDTLELQYTEPKLMNICDTDDGYFILHTLR